MSLDDTLRVAGLVEDSIVDGDGFRFTIFVQGCKRCCPNCQNPETQPLEGGHEETLEALLQKIRQNPLLTGVTFSGGEPFLQCAPLAKLAKEIHAMGLDIWSYSATRSKSSAHATTKPPMPYSPKSTYSSTAPTSKSCATLPSTSAAPPTSASST